MNLADTIAAFWCCTQIPPVCAKCPEHGPTGELGRACKFEVKEAVYDWLKAQAPKVMKVGEVRNWVHSDRTTREPIFVEMRSGVCAWIIDDEVREIPGAENLTSDLYSKTWRCWTARPTDEQREKVKWDA